MDTWIKTSMLIEKQNPCNCRNSGNNSESYAPPKSIIPNVFRTQIIFQIF